MTGIRGGLGTRLKATSERRGNARRRTQLAQGGVSAIALLAVFLCQPMTVIAQTHEAPAQTKAQDIDPWSIPPDIREWTEEEQATVLDLFRRANELQSTGEYAQAEPLWREALSIFEASWGPDHPVTQIPVNNLALNLNNQGRFGEAEPLYRRSLSIRQAKLGPDHPTTATSLNNLASNLDAQGRYGEAEPLYRWSLSICEAKLGTDHPDTALSLNNLALNLNDQGRYGEAEPLFRRALAIWKAKLGPEHPDTATILENLSVSDLRLGQPLDAFGFARRAYDVRRALQDQGASGSGAVSETSTIKLGSDLALSGRLLSRSAYEASGMTEDVAEAQSMSSTGFEGVLAISVSPAAQALSEAAGRQVVASKGSADVLAAWQAAKARVAGIDQKITAEASRGPDGDARRAELFAEREAAVAALSGAEALLNDVAPEYFDLFKPQQVSVEALQSEVLSDGEALVLIYPGASWMPEGHQNGLVYVVTKTEVEVAELPLGPEALSDKVCQIRQQLNPGERCKVSAASVAASAGGGVTPVVDETRSPMQGASSSVTVSGFDRKVAHELYQVLFGDPKIAAALAGHDRWLLAPQGTLMSLPFATLVMEPPEAGSRDNDPEALRATHWLGLERILVTLPSVSSLQLYRSGTRGSSSATTPFFGLGDPLFDGAVAGETRGARAADNMQLASAEVGAAQSYFRGGAGDVSELRKLARLPRTRDEIETLGAAFHAPEAAILLQGGAREDVMRTRENRLSTARIIAFATHGLITGDLADDVTGRPGLAEPALALTPPTDEELQGLEINQNRTEAEAAFPLQADPANDGLLTSSEVAGMSLIADWVILSACNTASGDGTGADALSGLARSFLYAGARSLLVSHFPVQDQAGMRLTTDAVRIADERPGLKRPEALREAMTKLANDTTNPNYAHPSAWAPYTLIDPG